MKTETKHFLEFVWGDKKSLWQHQRRANIASYSVPIGYNGKNMAINPTHGCSTNIFWESMSDTVPKKTFLKLENIRKTNPQTPKTVCQSYTCWEVVRRGGWTHLLLCSDLIFTMCANYLRSQSLNFLTCKG